MGYVFKLLYDAGLTVAGAKCSLLYDYPELHDDAVKCLKTTENVCETVISSAFFSYR